MAGSFAFHVVRDKIFSSTFLSWLVCLLSQTTVIILLQQFKHYPVESDWAMRILSIEHHSLVNDI